MKHLCLPLAIVCIVFLSGCAASAEDTTPAPQPTEARPEGTATPRTPRETSTPRPPRTPTPEAAANNGGRTIPLQITVDACVKIPNAIGVVPPSVALTTTSGAVLDITFDDAHIYTKNQASGAETTYNREQTRNRWIRMDGEDRLTYCQDSSNRLWMAPQPD